MFEGLWFLIPRGNVLFMEDTIWLPIDGFEGYEVNQYSHIRTWRRRECKWRESERRSAVRDQPKRLKGTVTSLGYTAYMLRKEIKGKPVRLMAHRVTAIAFLGKPEKHHTDVAHLDGDPTNNHISNLKWTTHRENQLMMELHGTIQFGEKSITCKLTQDIVRRIRDECATGPRGTQRRIAKDFNMSVAQICRIVKGSRWRHTF